MTREERRAVTVIFARSRLVDSGRLSRCIAAKVVREYARSTAKGVITLCGRTVVGVYVSKGSNKTWDRRRCRECARILMERGGVESG